MDNPLIEPCPWTVAQGFYSEERYQEYLEWLARQVAAGVAETVPIPREFSRTSREHHWYRHLASRQVWCLMRPEERVSGHFKPAVGQLLQDYFFQLPNDDVLSPAFNRVWRMARGDEDCDYAELRERFLEFDLRHGDGLARLWRNQGSPQLRALHREILSQFDADESPPPSGPEQGPLASFLRFFGRRA